MESIFRQIEEYIPHYKKRNPKVSKATVGWQLDHILRSTNLIIKGLGHSNPEEYQDNFNFKGKLIFFLGKIHRGKAKAPKVAQKEPEEIITEESLIEKLEKAKHLYSKLDEMLPNQFAKHPYFGNINLKRARKFLKIHANHHLKIVRDILK